MSDSTGRVVYSADQETDEVVELFSVPLAGGAFLKLNPSLVPNGDTYAFELSPNSARSTARETRNKGR